MRLAPPLRSRRSQAAVALTGAVVLAITVGGQGAGAAIVNQPSGVSATMSYTATASQVVSATASWGSPAIAKTVSATLTVSDTESATRSTTLAQAANVSSAARSTALFQAQIAAITAASIAANTNASIALAQQVEPKQMSLYNQALAQAKAAVIARDGQPTGGRVSACGAPLYKSDETPWTCTFDDEFNGTKLDTTKWTAWNGVNYWGQNNVCFYNDPSHVSVAGGSLNLSVTKLPNGTKCSTPNGTTTPTYGAGVVHSKGNFSQTYGLFQARIKFAGGNGIHNDFWLYPDDTSSGDHAEIDIAEPVGSSANTMYSAIHRTSPGAATADELGVTKWCSMPNWAAGYHTFELQWTPTQLQFVYDGTICSIQPNTGEFNRNFFAILEVLADAGSAAPTASTRLPATMSVDWVRIWK